MKSSNGIVDDFLILSWSDLGLIAGFISLYNKARKQLEHKNPKQEELKQLVLDLSDRSKKYQAINTDAFMVLITEEAGFIAFKRSLGEYMKFLKKEDPHYRDTAHSVDIPILVKWLPILFH